MAHEAIRARFYYIDNRLENGRSLSFPSFYFLYNKCFGYNDKGQLGQGDTVSRGVSGGEMGDALLAIDLGTGVSAEALTAGCSHNCVLLSDETVKCFGYNNYGQLGQVRNGKP